MDNSLRSNVIQRITLDTHTWPWLWLARPSRVCRQKKGCNIHMLLKAKWTNLSLFITQRTWLNLEPRWCHPGIKSSKRTRQWGFKKTKQRQLLLTLKYFIELIFLIVRKVCESCIGTETPESRRSRAAQQKLIFMGLQYQKNHTC